MTPNLPTSGRLPATGLHFLELPLGLFRGLQGRLAGRRWRRARPFAHLNDHLRRDVGLPPLDPAKRWW